MRRLKDANLAARIYYNKKSILSVRASPMITDTIISKREECKVRKITYNGVVVYDFTNKIDNRKIVKNEGTSVIGLSPIELKQLHLKAMGINRTAVK